MAENTKPIEVLKNRLEVIKNCQECITLLSNIRNDAIYNPDVLSDRVLTLDRINEILQNTGKMLFGNEIKNQIT